jgi:hypothetical protein
MLVRSVDGGKVRFDLKTDLPLGGARASGNAALAQARTPSLSQARTLSPGARSPTSITMHVSELALVHPASYSEYEAPAAA